MKRFKVSSNNSNKLTSHDFEALATKLAASWPPRRPPKPLPKIKNLISDLKRASDLHNFGNVKESLSGSAQYAYVATKLIETVGQTTGLGSLLGPALQFVTLAMLISKTLKPKFQKMIASSNELFREFDERKFAVKKYAADELTRISPVYVDKKLTLKEIAENHQGMSEANDAAWVGKDNFVYVFKNDNDVREIQRMINTMDAKTMTKIAKIIAVSGAIGYWPAYEAIRNLSDKQARESPTGQAVKQEGLQVPLSTTDPSKISPSLQDRLNRKPTKPTDTFRTQKYPNRKK